MANTARQWDIGTHIQIDMGEDVSEALALRMLFRKTNRTTLDKVGVVGDPNTSIRYTTEDGDIDQAGTWRVQGWMQHTNGSWTSKSAKLVVEEAILRVE